MSFKEVGLVLGSLVVGGLIGNALSGSRLDGRLSACRDIVGVLNQAVPLQLGCEVVKGDVYISSPLQPGIKVSLDGKDVLQ